MQTEEMSTATDIMRRILDAESRAIAAIPVSDAYERAVDLIIEHVHRRHGKLVLSLIHISEPTRPY